MYTIVHTHPITGILKVFIGELLHIFSFICTSPSVSGPKVRVSAYESQEHLAEGGAFC